MIERLDTLRQALVEKRALIASMAALTLFAAGCGSSNAESTSAQPPTPTPSPEAKVIESRIGNDVSYPQCRETLPKGQAFGIVGLNGTLANNFNPCAKAELKWAQRSTGNSDQPKASVYVHIGNPGNVIANDPKSDWPRSGDTPYGSCSGENDEACAFQYGENLAGDDIREVTPDQPATFTWWLDVEPNYSWEHRTSLNDASMEGMVDGFENAGVQSGIYSNAKIWREIAGTPAPGSDLNGLPDWVLGAHSPAQAAAKCALASFTGGEVNVTQFTTGGTDGDYPCD